MITKWKRWAFYILLVMVIAIITTSCAGKSRLAELLRSDPQAEADHATVMSPAAGTATGSSKAEAGAQQVKQEADQTKLPVYTKEQLKAYPEDIRDILSRGKLRVALYHEDRYPFFYVDAKGVLRGSDIELAQDIALKLGVEAEFIRTAPSFDAVINQVSTGEADIGVSKLSTTLERAKRVLFSDAYLNLKQALLINRLQLAAIDHEGDVHDPLALIQGRGDRIGIVAGTSYAGFAHDLFPRQTQVGYGTSTQLFDAVKQGDVLAVVYDAFEISRYLKKYPAVSLELQFMQLDEQDDDIAVAVNPRRYHLQQWINTYLHMEKKEIRKLLERNDI
ncbi:substrate-binding periplasmic protein [Paenibacillus amylolyticus]|uniref:substrate-binding periplasmic protein n=1 Tax=Paenibacillus amylolyticus TaxID=1451 RepID=UPI003EBEB989